MSEKPKVTVCYQAWLVEDDRRTLLASSIQNLAGVVEEAKAFVEREPGSGCVVTICKCTTTVTHEVLQEL